MPLVALVRATDSLEMLLQDKSEPNDLRTAKRVVESIQDDLNEQEM